MILRYRLFKKRNNSVYGKTTENVRKRSNIRIANFKDIALKHIAKPSFNSHIKINDNLIIIHRYKNLVNLKKLFHLVVSSLDYSKLLMYHYHYGVFKKFYKDKVRLLMTDIDSLFHEIKTDDVYKDRKLRNMFNNSNFRKLIPISLMKIIK